jgi:hypothetical protein
VADQRRAQILSDPLDDAQVHPEGGELGLLLQGRSRMRPNFDGPIAEPWLDAGHYMAKDMIGRKSTTRASQRENMSRLVATMLTFAVFAAAAEQSFAEATPQQRKMCAEAAKKFAKIIVDNRGQENSMNKLYDDAMRPDLASEVWNSMLLSYQQDKRLDERQLATLGNASCLAKL